MRQSESTAAGARPAVEDLKMRRGGFVENGLLAYSGRLQLCCKKKRNASTSKLSHPKVLSNHVAERLSPRRTHTHTHTHSKSCQPHIRQGIKSNKGMQCLPSSSGRMSHFFFSFVKFESHLSYFVLYLSDAFVLAGLGSDPGSSGQGARGTTAEGEEGGREEGRAQCEH